jgi:hypothetical protein
MTPQRLLLVSIPALFLFCCNLPPAANTSETSRVDPTGSTPSPALTHPPFGGTLFIDPDIITPDDPSSFAEITPRGRGIRTMFDRRVNDWIVEEAYLFEVRFGKDKIIEAQVNPEFTAAEAAEHVARYAPVIGQIPLMMLDGVETLWMHDGEELFGGGNRNLLIHVGQGDNYEREGILEEVFIHEAAHSTLDEIHAEAPAWLLAQQKDTNFISDYARDNPLREDVAESFPCYLALRVRPDRLSRGMLDTIRSVMPHRIDYFDAQEFDWFPMEVR